MSSEELLHALAYLENDFIEEAENAYETGKLPVRRNYAKYLAIAAALAIMILGVARPGILVQAAQAVMQWFEDHVSYHFRSETTMETVPQYMLRGIQEDYRLMDEEYHGDMGSATYESMEGKGKLYFLYGLSSGEVQAPGKEMNYEIIVDRDGTELYYVYPQAEGQEGSLTWVSEDGQVVFSISGALSEQELLEIRRHVTAQSGVLPDYQETTDSAAGFEGIIAKMTEEQAYAVWRPESEHPILLIAEGTYEIDGANASILCEVYGLQEGVPKYLGYLACGGTAYPLQWDDNYIYVSGGHFWGRYGISVQEGTLRLNSGLSYIPAEDGYRVSRDAAVEETFDENGEPYYISEGEWMDEAGGEKLMLQLQEEAGKAEIINFIRAQ